MSPELAVAAITRLSERLQGAEAEVRRLQDVEAENRRLLLQVQDLKQQLGARKAPLETSAARAIALSLVAEDPTLPAPVLEVTPGEAPSAPSRTPTTVRSPTTDTPRGRRPLDPALPREVIVLADPPVAERVCALTGVPLTRGFTEALEVLARRAPVYYVKRLERTVWVSPAKSAPLATPWPPDVLPRSGVHASIVAHIAAAHFSEHLPYYRLEQQLARTGVTLARSTQVSLMAQLDTLVAPLVAHIKTRVLGSGYVHLDATPIDVCDPARPGEARSATLWAYRARSPDPPVEGLVWFDYHPTKSPARPSAVLRDGAYHGVVQTDGASGLNTLGPPDVITHLGCWAHAHRYFAEAVDLGEPRAVAHRARIAQLFRLEARARRALARVPTASSRIAAWRNRFRIPLMQTIFTRAITDGLTVPPKSALGIALGYLLGQRASLERCVTTPGAYLDNNGAENAIRPLKLGAKNWLFIGHPSAGPRLANLFTLVENCRLIGLDPEIYLLDLVTRLPAHSIRRLDDWLPRAWQRARADGIIP